MPRHYDPSTVSAAVALARVGIGPTMIGSILSVPPSTVGQWLTRRPKLDAPVPASGLGRLRCAVCDGPLASHSLAGECSPPVPSVMPAVRFGRLIGAVGYPDNP